MRYGIYLKTKHGTTFLEKVRRRNGASNALNEHVMSKRNVLKRKAHLPDRVITGPIHVKGSIEATAVVLLPYLGKPHYSIYYVVEIRGGQEI